LWQILHVLRLLCALITHTGTSFYYLWLGSSRKFRKTQEKKGRSTFPLPPFPGTKHRKGEGARGRQWQNVLPLSPLPSFNTAVVPAHYDRQTPAAPATAPAWQRLAGGLYEAGTDTGDGNSEVALALRDCVVLVE